MARHVSGSEKALAARAAMKAALHGHELDTADVRILTVLQKDGRISNVNLSRLAGLSPPPTLRRTATLEERGIIKGYHAEIDTGKFGYAITAFILVGLASQSRSDIVAFEHAMAHLTNVRECHAVSGQRDFLLKCLFHDLTESNTFTRDILLRTPNVRTVTTSFAMTKTKSEPGVPLERVEAGLSLGDIRKLRRAARTRRS